MRLPALHKGSDLISLVTTREEISDLLALDDVIDLVIPRGGNALVSYIQVGVGGSETGPPPAGSFATLLTHPHTSCNHVQAGWLFVRGAGFGGGGGAMCSMLAGKGREGREFTGHPWW